MRHHYFNKHLRRTLMAAVIATPGLLFAGNIPQYQVSRGINTYVEFTDGTPIPCSWNIGEYGIYPGGKEYANPCTYEGFPIGFDFRYAGSTINQFVVSSLGEMYVGYNQVKWGSEMMKIAMYPIKSALNSGSFSYKTTGEEGNRIFQLQLNEAVVNESGSYIARYSLQYRLYEADGTIEFAHSELETGYQTYFGFHTGLWGLNVGDAILLTAKGLNPALDLNISAATGGSNLNPNSYIAWDRDDFDHFYQNVYVFDMPKDVEAPASAPKNLSVSETGSTLSISCERADDADATVILYSTEPFTESDYPVDGESFSISGGKTFGKATVLYYANGKTPTATIKNISPDKEYYIEAVSANGYPNFNTTNTASVKFIPSQAPPANFKVSSVDKNKIRLSWNSDYPVIVAVTTEKQPGYEVGYKGLFGTPDVVINAGDEISGGGRVIFVGEGSECSFETEPNTLTFFRAWTVKEGRLSTTFSDTYCIPEVTMPYEPNLENYPTYVSIEGWQAKSSNTTLTSYMPLIREYYNDDAVLAVSVDRSKNILTSPTLPLDAAPTKISFEFALETVLPPNQEGVPMGNEPGYFGSNGYLKINVGGENYKTITSYEGSMVTSADGYESMSSTFIPVEVEIPMQTESLPFSFEFSSNKQSYLYIRNIKVEYIGEVSKAPTQAPANAMADEDRNAILHFSCDRAEDAEYTLVLFSTQPISADSYPEDGTILTVGAKPDTTKDVVVLYYGSDEKVECETNYDIVVPEFDTTYYFVALSASGNPLYNRNNVASVEYTTLKEVGKSIIESAVFTEEDMTINIKAKRHENAATTLLLLSEGKFEGSLEDAKTYTVGENVGNATVLYHGNEEVIEHKSNLIEPDKSYILTSASANERGWWADAHDSMPVSTLTTAIEAIEKDNEKLEIYNIVGMKIEADKVEDLAKGIYIINGQKTVIR